MRIVVDSCFWFGLVDVYDEHHVRAADIFEVIKNNAEFIIPFPTLYETLNTRLLRPMNRGNLSRVETLTAKLKGEPNRYIKIKDTPYIDAAYSKTIENNRRGLSFVDNIIREMILDRSLKIERVLTFNVGDFADICGETPIYCL